MVKNKENIPAKTVESLFNKVANLIEQARARVATAMLSERLISTYESGWTVDTLKRCRFFYRIYCPQQIGATLLPQSDLLPEFTLSWSRYLVLMRIKNDEERRFYET